MSESKILALGSDHAGYDLKQFIKNELIVQGFDIKDFGCYSPDSVDYPDIIHPLAQEINEGRIKRGIILCGTGIGVNVFYSNFLSNHNRLSQKPSKIKAFPINLG